MFKRSDLPQSQRGFTLIELLVVISLITFLLSVVLPHLNTLQQKGRDAARISTVKQIKNAMDIYWPNHFRYPLPDGGATCMWLYDPDPDLAEPQWKDTDQVMGGEIKDPLFQNFRYCTPAVATGPYGHLYASSYGIKVRLEDEERKKENPVDLSGDTSIDGYCKTGVNVEDYPGDWADIPLCNF